MPLASFFVYFLYSASRFVASRRRRQPRVIAKATGACIVCSTTAATLTCHVPDNYRRQIRRSIAIQIANSRYPVALRRFAKICRRRGEEGGNVAQEQGGCSQGVGKEPLYTKSKNSIYSRFLVRSGRSHLRTTEPQSRQPPFIIHGRA